MRSELARRQHHAAQVGQPIPTDVRPVRPKRHATTWLAWRDNRWAPVHRVKGLGWVWSE